MCSKKYIPELPKHNDTITVDEFRGYIRLPDQEHMATKFEPDTFDKYVLYSMCPYRLPEDRMTSASFTVSHNRCI